MRERRWLGEAVTFRKRRKSYGEGVTHAVRIILQADFGAMDPGDFQGDGQTKSGAVVALAKQSMKTLENPFAFAHGNARTIIADRDRWLGG